MGVCDYLFPLVGDPFPLSHDRRKIIKGIILFCGRRKSGKHRGTRDCFDGGGSIQSAFGIRGSVAGSVEQCYWELLWVDGWVAVPNNQMTNLVWRVTHEYWILAPE